MVRYTKNQTPSTNSVPHTKKDFIRTTPNIEIQLEVFPEKLNITYIVYRKYNNKFGLTL